MLTSKVCSCTAACAGIKDGARLLVGGFGQPGTPNTLIRQLLAQGSKNLTLVKNDANEPGLGVSTLIEAGRVKKMIASHIGLNPLAVSMMHEGRLEIEVYPQGILAEKIRAGGAGLGGILTDIGLHLVTEGEQTVELEGLSYKIEPALRGHVALIHAAMADEVGNLVFTKTASNFNPVMAMAADLVIVETEQLVPVGKIDPDQVHLAGAFVDRLVLIEELTPDYGVLKHHALQKQNRTTSRTGNCSRADY
ncbi:MAG: CoA transferase subunit A [Deltaproteobacteria bacterium]|nr:CoA transferase subunit A [Deltaproteobacteria bacterium]NCP02665.1 CoA transferase subunit A [Deltaproteobacteria bacterium]